MTRPFGTITDDPTRCLPGASEQSQACLAGLTERWGKGLCWSAFPSRRVDKPTGSDQRPQTQSMILFITQTIEEKSTIPSHRSATYTHLLSTH